VAFTSFPGLEVPVADRRPRRTEPIGTAVDGAAVRLATSAQPQGDRRSEAAIGPRCQSTYANVFDGNPDWNAIPVAGATSSASARLDLHPGAPSSGLDEGAVRSPTSSGRASRRPRRLRHDATTSPPPATSRSIAAGRSSSRRGSGRRTSTPTARARERPGDGARDVREHPPENAMVRASRADDRPRPSGDGWTSSTPAERYLGREDAARRGRGQGVRQRLVARLAAKGTSPRRAAVVAESYERSTLNWWAWDPAPAVQGGRARSPVGSRHETLTSAPRGRSVPARTSWSRSRGRRGGLLHRHARLDTPFDINYYRNGGSCRPCSQDASGETRLPRPRRDGHRLPVPLEAGTGALVDSGMCQGRRSCACGTGGARFRSGERPMRSCLTTHLDQHRAPAPLSKGFEGPSSASAQRGLAEISSRRPHLRRRRRYLTARASRSHAPALPLSTRRTCRRRWRSFGRCPSVGPGVNHTFAFTTGGPALLAHSAHVTCARGPETRVLFSGDVGPFDAVLPGPDLAPMPNTGWKRPTATDPPGPLSPRPVEGPQETFAVEASPHPRLRVAGAQQAFLAHTLVDGGRSELPTNRQPMASTPRGSAPLSGGTG